MIPDPEILTAYVRRNLDGWAPAPADPVEEAAAVTELNEVFGLAADDEDAWTVERLRSLREPYEPVDDDQARDILAVSIACELRRLIEIPGPRNWRRWSLARRAVRAGYRLGVVEGYSDLMDESGTWMRNVRLGRSSYLLGLGRSERDCLRTQLSYARHGHQPPGGWHRPGSAEVWSICGRCLPWHCCESTTYDHLDGCPEST